MKILRSMRSMRSMEVIAVFVGLVILGACVPQMPDQEPTNTIPEHFNETLNGPAADEHWWLHFHMPHLNDYIDLALKDNDDIKLAIGKIQQADAQYVVSQAPLLPLIDTSDSFQRARSSTLESPYRIRGNSLLDLGINVSYEVDFWGKNRYLADTAQFNAIAARFDKETVRITTQTSVANVYFTILATEDRLNFNGQNLVVANQLLELINQRLAAGTGTALDQAQQQSTVDNLKALRPALQLNIAQNTHALAILLGKPPEAVKTPSEKLLDAALPKIGSGLPSSLLFRRPDIASVEAQLAGAYANLAAARAKFFPTIQLTGSTGYRSLSLSRMFRSPNDFYSIGVGLSEPIFDNGLLQGNFDEINAQRQQLLATYNQTILRAFSDVENALSSLHYLAEQEKLQHQSLVDSQRALDLSQQRLKEGTIDLVTVLNTENTLFAVQDLIVQTRLQRLQALVSLYQALGGGWNGIDYYPLPTMSPQLTHSALSRAG